MRDHRDLLVWQKGMDLVSCPANTLPKGALFVGRTYSEIKEVGLKSNGMT